MLELNVMQMEYFILAIHIIGRHSIEQGNMS